MNAGISAADTVRHLADIAGRRTTLTSSPTVAGDSTKLFVGSPRTACRSSPFSTSSAGMSASLSNSLSAAQRRTGAAHHMDHYHTLATSTSAKRNTPSFTVISSSPDSSSSSSQHLTGNSGAITVSTMPLSSAAMKYYDFNKFGDSSSIAAVMVAGSPKRYATNVGGVMRGQHHRQHRGRVKMTETVSDMNLAHHLLSGARPPEQSIYGTIDRNMTTANRRHLVTKNGGVTTNTDSDRASLETSAQLGKSLQALSDTIV